MKTIRFFVLLCSVLLMADGLTAQTVSLETLLKDMVNRDVPARYPSPEYMCRQFSSYDRATVSKDQPGWFANEDFNQFMRVEENDGRTEFVLMDTDGSGAIVRFWMTFTGAERGKGTLRFYIDGNRTPVIEGTPFDIISGKGLTDGILATSVSELTPHGERGHNLYLPIPYAKSCKVTYQTAKTKTVNGRLVPEETVYYNINYRTYAPSAKVIPYSKVELNKNKQLITEVQRKLTDNHRDVKDMKLSNVSLDCELAAGASKSIGITGSRAVREIALTIDAKDYRQALRSTVVEIAFDGAKSVWIPVGDLFGIGYDKVKTENWYTSASVDGKMNAYWVMPFAKDCKITLHNYGNQNVSIKGAARHGAWKWDSRSMHFGANWHQYTKISTRSDDTSKGDFLDLNINTLNGKGVYLGDGVTIFNTVNSWWGEGDEKVYVDGESFPSHIGTGTEDYYGYAWCSPSVFTEHPFIAQPVGKGSFEAAYSINTRYRSLDLIPFTKSIKFDIELWHWTHCIVNYAPVSFWYMFPDGKSLVAEDVAGVKESIALKKRDVTDRGLLNLNFESENMVITDAPATNMEYQVDARWSNGSQIFWTGVNKGDKFTLSFRTGAAGTYDASCLFTVARDYGIVNVYINGELVGENINLFSNNVDVKNIFLKDVALKNGVNTVTFEIVKLPAGFDKCVFGFDKLIFKE